MGIKDKVLDILFDDDNDNQEDVNLQDNNKYNENRNTNPIHDTGSIFIDATSPLNATTVNSAKNTEDNENAETKEPAYQMSENISPIFGPINSKNKKPKNLSKIKNINDISNKKFDTAPKSQGYSKVVISPIFGPISTKSTKKVKARKKDIDPFYRDINDTGSFDTVLNESEEDVLDQQIEQADSEPEAVEHTDSLGDTDRLDRISDRINRIKNEAANLYHEEGSNDDIIEKDGYDVETIEYSSISEVIHDVQNHDEKMEHTAIRHPQQDNNIEFGPIEEVQEEEFKDPFEEVKENEKPVDIPAVQDVEEPVDEPVEEIIEETIEEPKEEPAEAVAPVEEITDEPKKTDEVSFDMPTFNPNNTVDNTPNGVLSEDDIFKDEDLDEGKDLFSVLFGDD